MDTSHIPWCLAFQERNSFQDSRNLNQQRLSPDTFRADLWIPGYGLPADSGHWLPDEVNNEERIDSLSLFVHCIRVSTDRFSCGHLSYGKRLHRDPSLNSCFSHLIFLFVLHIFQGAEDNLHSSSSAPSSRFCLLDFFLLLHQCVGQFLLFPRLSVVLHLRQLLPGHDRHIFGFPGLFLFEFLPTFVLRFSSVAVHNNPGSFPIQTYICSLLTRSWFRLQNNFRTSHIFCRSVFLLLHKILSLCVPASFLSGTGLLFGNPAGFLLPTKWNWYSLLLLLLFVVMNRFFVCMHRRWFSSSSSDHNYALPDDCTSHRFCLCPFHLLTHLLFVQYGSPESNDHM